MAENVSMSDTKTMSPQDDAQFALGHSSSIDGASAGSHVASAQDEEERRAIAAECQAKLDPRKVGAFTSRPLLKSGWIALTGKRDGKRQKAVGKLTYRSYRERRDEIGDDFFQDEATFASENQLVKIEVVPKKDGGHKRALHSIRRWKNKKGEIVSTPSSSAQGPGADQDLLNDSDLDTYTPNPNSSHPETPADSDDPSRFPSSYAASWISSPVDSPDLSRTSTNATDQPTRLSLPSQIPTRASIAESSLSLSRQQSQILTVDQPMDTPRRRITFQSAVTNTRAKSKRAFDEILRTRQRQYATGQSAQVEQSDSAFAKALAAIAGGEREEEKIEVMVLYENQRGLVVFGLPRFSSGALFQLDPSSFQNSRLRNSPYTRHEFGLPTPQWNWLDPDWMVDMGGDVDEHGWSYATHFGSRHWRGVANTGRSFVRRRRWVRASIFIPESQQDSREEDEFKLLVDWTAMQKYAQEYSDSLKHRDQNKECKDCGQPRTVSPSKGCSHDSPGTEPTPPRAVVGLRDAISLLPVSNAFKDELYAWQPDTHAVDPFLAWSTICARGGDRVLGEYRRHQRKWDLSNDEDALVERWRQAVVEINYRRAASMMRVCALDRSKLILWRRWLNLEADETAEDRPKQDNNPDDDEDEEYDCSSGDDDLAKRRRPLASPTRLLRRTSSKRDKRKLAPKNPKMDDIWDLAESRLGEILHLFEFQASRVSLLLLFISTYSVSHRYGLEPQETPPPRRLAGDVSVPDIRSAATPTSDPRREQLSLIIPTVTDRLAPRLEFYNDLVATIQRLKGHMGDAVQVAGNTYDAEKVQSGPALVGVQQHGQSREASMDVKSATRRDAAGA
ncbi:BQ5605_C004g03093 [Microbotryum silenes-dioicae]|uniref:BQ5605_C004g03093 protein n=1 Tax=Microbotryum silenes-dioicae TaxID=796604 RepID=A0A2X0M9U5_9BASI|nr:BQ5605_C004g03093 [Microbotryum silenes-dioicae]